MRLQGIQMFSHVIAGRLFFSPIPCLAGKKPLKQMAAEHAKFTLKFHISFGVQVE